MIVQTHASWKVAYVVTEVSTQPSVTPEPSPASRHSLGGRKVTKSHIVSGMGKHYQ